MKILKVDRATQLENMNKDNVSTEVTKIETSSTGEKVVVTLRPVCKGICSTTYSLVPILSKLFKMTDISVVTKCVAINKINVMSDLGEGKLDNLVNRNNN
jgi:hypothetical protein